MTACRAGFDSTGHVHAAAHYGVFAALARSNITHNDLGPVYADTHLEVRFPDPNDPASAILQSLQSYELVGTLLATSSEKDLILLGDFNSSPVHVPIGSILPPYQFIAGAGFTDVWDTNPLARFDPNGFTCCEPPDLANRRTTQYERIDIIFVRGSAYRSWALVTGRFPISSILAYNTRAMVDLPDPERPVKKTVNPWREGDG